MCSRTLDAISRLEWATGGRGLNLDLKVERDYSKGLIVKVSASYVVFDTLGIAEKACILTRNKC